MSKHNAARVLVLASVLSTGLVATSFAADEPTANVPVDSDLTAVIALQGLPCGKVVEAREQGKDEYLATCEDGHRYRVFVNADGRVVVEKRD